MYFSIGLHRPLEHYNRLVSVCIVMFVFHVEKNVTVCGFLCFISSYFVFVQSFNPASRTTCVKNAYQSLTAIPLQVEVNNSLKIFPVTGIREKIFGVFVPV